MMMFTVALIGPDGAGKTTICRLLERTLPVPAKYVYMGINLETSNLVLPTTWLVLQVKRALGKRPDMAGPRSGTDSKPRPKGVFRRTAAGVKSGLRLMNQVAEEWFRQAVVWWYVRRGYVVLFDRDFFSDYYAADIAADGQDRALGSRLHGFLLEHFYRKPDLVICLDAPAEVLFARKGEATLEFLERRRKEYQQLGSVVEDFFTVDVTRSAEDVTGRIGQLIQKFYTEKRAA